jgi:hypothetical protein
MRVRAVGLVLVAAVAAFSCSSKSNGGGGGGDGVTFSCTISGVSCIQAIAASSEIPAEQSACTKAGNSFAQAPCPDIAYAGCCNLPAAQEIDCYYPSIAVSVFQSACTKDGGTWMAGDGGVSDAGSNGDAASGPEAFVGTWARSGTETITCPTGNPNQVAITGNLVIALGSASNTITGTTPDGCQTSYTVSGAVASATPNQTCNITTEAGVAEVLTVSSRTFNLSADGQTITAQGNGTLDKTATSTTCTITSSGTYTKQ